jgi:hypothetical protein
MAQKDKDAEVVPHSSIDTEAGWTYSGWHGWVYGWKLHLACTVAEVWIPLAARLTLAKPSDSRVVPLPIEELPDQACLALGDTHYNAPNVREACLARGMLLVASGRRGPYPHTDAGTEVRRILHRLRHLAIRNLDEHFKALFEAHGAVGLWATPRSWDGESAIIYRYGGGYVISTPRSRRRPTQPPRFVPLCRLVRPTAPPGSCGGAEALLDDSVRLARWPVST